MLLSLPIDVVLVPVEGENLVGPAPRPSHALTEPCRLLRRTDPPFRSQPEVGLELRQAQRPQAGCRHAVWGRGRLSPRRRRSCQVHAEGLNDQPAAGAVESARPPIGGRQHLAGQGDGNSGEGHGSYSVLLDTINLLFPTALPQVTRGRYSTAPTSSLCSGSTRSTSCSPRRCGACCICGTASPSSWHSSPRGCCSRPRGRSRSPCPSA